MEEQWKNLEDYPPIELSSHGRVKRNGELVDYNFNKTNYITIAVNGKLKSLHRLLMETFIGPCPDKYVVNHIDGNIHNNRIDNLEYITQRENIQPHKKHKDGSLKSVVILRNVPDDIKAALQHLAVDTRVKLPAMAIQALTFYVQVVRSPGMEAATKDNGTTSEEVIKILADAYARGDVKID